MNKVNRYGLTTDEYINLIKECNMATKKWTLSRIKMFHKRRLEILATRDKNLKNKLERLGMLV